MTPKSGSCLKDGFMMWYIWLLLALPWSWLFTSIYLSISSIYCSIVPSIHILSYHSIHSSINLYIVLLFHPFIHSAEYCSIFPSIRILSYHSSHPSIRLCIVLLFIHPSIIHILSYNSIIHPSICILFCCSIDSSIHPTVFSFIVPSISILSYHSSHLSIHPFVYCSVVLSSINSSICKLTYPSIIIILSYHSIHSSIDLYIVLSFNPSIHIILLSGHYLLELTCLIITMINKSEPNVTYQIPSYKMDE